MKKRYPKKIIVAGFGSIGKRHVRNLLDLGITPYIVTRYPDPAMNVRFFSSVKEIEDPGSFTHAIIATPTARHLEDTRLIADAGVKNILVEKPLDSTTKRGRQILKIAKAKKARVSVAYNMRYLASLGRIRDFVAHKMCDIRIVEALVGHYLPSWRPDWNYADSYRAHRKAGGGVDLDLSHEVDYVLWLFGKDFKKKMVYSAKISTLKIDAPDMSKVILDYGRRLADITLDCIRRPKERHLKIICEDGSGLYHDFMANTLSIGRRRFSFRDDMENSYKKMLASFLGSCGKGAELLCTGAEGLDVLKVLGV